MADKHGSERRTLISPELVLAVGLALFDAAVLPLHMRLSSRWIGDTLAPNPPLGWWVFTTVYFAIFVWIVLVSLGWGVRSVLASAVALAFGCICTGTIALGGRTSRPGTIVLRPEPAPLLIVAACTFLLIVLSVQHRKLLRDQ